MDFGLASPVKRMIEKTYKIEFQCLKVNRGGGDWVSAGRIATLLGKG